MSIANNDLKNVKKNYSSSFSNDTTTKEKNDNKRSWFSAKGSDVTSRRAGFPVSRVTHENVRTFLRSNRRFDNVTVKTVGSSGFLVTEVYPGAGWNEPDSVGVRAFSPQRGVPLLLLLLLVGFARSQRSQGFSTSLGQSDLEPGVGQNREYEHGRETEYSDSSTHEAVKTQGQGQAEPTPEEGGRQGTLDRAGWVETQ